MDAAKTGDADTARSLVEKRPVLARKAQQWGEPVPSVVLLLVAVAHSAQGVSRALRWHCRFCCSAVLHPLLVPSHTPTHTAVSRCPHSSPATHTC